MSGESILIVDDNATNAKLVLYLLERVGYAVRVAIDVPEARRMIAAQKPRLILMDVQLPGIDGLTFTRELKSDPALRDIVIVVLTAYAMKSDQDKARDAGSEGYISKPIETKTFAATVAEYLRRGAIGSPAVAPAS